MKFITAVVVFSVTFGFAAFVTTLLGANQRLHYYAIENNSTSNQISAFIQRDVDNGQEMDIVAQYSPSLFEYSQAVQQYVDSSESMEDVNMPPDFRFAWREHMNAWRAQSDFLNSHYSRNVFDKKEFFRIYTNQNDEIKKTWFNVLEVAKKYNAIIPENAY